MHATGTSDVVSAPRLAEVQRAMARANALYVAADRADLQPSYESSGLVVGTLRDADLAHRFGLVSGAVIVSANGEPVHRREALDTMLQDIAASGEELTLEIRLDGVSTTVTTTLDERLLDSPLQPSQAVLGVSAYPVDPSVDVDGARVDWDDDRYQGESATLAASLALYQVLKGRQGDPKFVATGFLTSDGDVVDVEGVDAKAVAVEQARIEYFLVPSDQAKIAREASSVTVVPVETIDDAIRWLESTPA
jgi:PDZ domain-containing secreted protein